MIDRAGRSVRCVELAAVSCGSLHIRLLALACRRTRTCVATLVDAPGSMMGPCSMFVFESSWVGWVRFHLALATSVFVDGGLLGTRTVGRTEK